MQPSTFGRGTPQYVRFEDPPFLERCEPHRLPDGTPATCSAHYYAFGVVAVELDLPFDCDWPGLLRGAVRWTAPAELEVQVREIVRVHLDRVAPAVARMYKDWLNEMYLVVNLEQVLDSAGQLMTSDALLSAHRGEIARIVSGEESPLAPSEVDETLRGSLSYYPHDLIVVTSSGALVYDRPEEAGAAVQIVEYAKIQLLEFRYYDRVMNRALGELYDALRSGAAFCARAGPPPATPAASTAFVWTSPSLPSASTMTSSLSPTPTTRAFIAWRPPAWASANTATWSMKSCAPPANSTIPSSIASMKPALS